MGTNVFASEFDILRTFDLTKFCAHRNLTFRIHCRGPGAGPGQAVPPELDISNHHQWPEPPVIPSNFPSTDGESTTVHNAKEIRWRIFHLSSPLSPLRVRLVQVHPRATGRNLNGKAQPSRDMSHGLHPEGNSLLVTPGGDYMDRILGCGPAGLPVRHWPGPAGKMLKL
jgi:hypothetical protein